MDEEPDLNSGIKAFRGVLYGFLFSAIIVAAVAAIVCSVM